MPEDPHQPEQPPNEASDATRTGPGSSEPPSSEDDLIAAARLAAEARTDHLPPEPDLPPPDYFPGYVVAREIHRGGQGIVYQAVHKGTKRKVAIKVMREGALASVRERTRFEREIEILAQLDHPCIVNVHDSGAVEGRFYYVMDYISGTTLDVWIGQHDLPIGEVLELFRGICEAVNAAHLKGVIHRDLKPANVRVDGNGRPHIVDFGLAKTATGSFTDDDKMMTVTGQFLGSLPWASPEQAQGVPGMIDVRTDVYSLGVMLYQMLTGRFPYQVVGNMRDVLDNILRSEPARPSTIRRQINDEVETIVLKCLSKERDRRYQNAGELARDLTHYLRGEPIEAKRDSGWYILKKTARRYRGVAAAAATLLVMLVTFSIAMSVLYAQKRDALAAEQTALRAEKVARQAVADEAAAKQEVIDTLERWFTAPDPTAGDARGTTVLSIVDKAAASVGDDLAGQPRTEAAIRRILGRTYFNLGQWGQAEPQLRRAMTLAEQVEGPDGEMKLFAQTTLAAGLRQADALDEAEALFTDALERTRRTLGPAHQRTITVLNNLSQLYKSKGDPAAAEPLLRDAVAAAESVPGFDRAALAMFRANLGETLLQLNRPRDAEPYLAGAVAALADAKGQSHPDTARARVRHAGLADALGDTAGAVAALRTAGDALADALGQTNNEVLATRVRLGQALSKLAQHDEAIVVLAAVLAAGEQQEPPGSPRLAWFRQALGAALVSADRPAEGRPLLESAAAVFREGKHPYLAQTLQSLLSACEAAGDSDAAERTRGELESLGG